MRSFTTVLFLIIAMSLANAGRGDPASPIAAAGGGTAAAGLAPACLATR